MKIGIVAPLALLLLGAAQQQEKAGESCSVRYSRILLGSYEQPVAQRTLPALQIAGEALPGKETFDFFDDDGSLSLAMLLAAWQADGTTAANQNAEVKVDRRDVALMGHAGRVGSAYFQAILDYARIHGNLNAQQVTEDAQAKVQFALFQRVEAQAQASLAAGTDGKATLPRRFITDIGSYFETLRPTAKDAVNSRYDDFATRTTSRLCDPAAASTLVGRILCDRNLGTGEARATPYCRSSAGITSPGRALTCEVEMVEGKPTLANCTDGAGGTRVPAPAIGN